jgi:serine phosphatase RsbU (regulator of sigma subunit)
LKIAERLQQAFVHIPSEMGPLRLGHLYRSATEAARVGGDFYDIFEAKDGKIAVLIGDVAGHGIEAARVAGLTKDVIHAFAHQSSQPNEVLHNTNGLLIEKLSGGFVSVFLGILDLKTGALDYASAGHPETLLRRRSGVIQTLGEGSPPVGVFPEARWEVARAELKPGDLLLLYTDGVTEARRNGDFFGQERLCSLLGQRRVRAEDLPQVILDEILDFSDGDLQDDVAVLALALAEDPA